MYYFTYNNSFNKDKLIYVVKLAQWFIQDFLSILCMTYVACFILPKNG